MASRILHKKSMQPCAANSDAHIRWKSRLGHVVAIQESNAAKRQAVAAAKPDAQPPQSGDAIRHQSLAAGLVDRENASIDHADVESAAAGGDRRGEASGATADNDDIRFRGGHHRNKTISEQKPGPMARSTPKLPGAG